MKKILTIVLSMVILVSFMCGCSTPNISKYECFALDTLITFEMQKNGWGEVYNGYNQKETIDNYEAMLSTKKEDSDIYKINNANGKGIKVSDQTAEIIREAIEISKLTDGAFDISIYEIMKLWGYDTKDYKVPSDEQIKETLKRTGYKNIEISDDNVVTVKNGATIDLGGIAKGYIADIVISGIDGVGEYMLTGAIVNFGGMVGTVGENITREDGSWVIGVEYPDSFGDYFATFKGTAATTSGPYQRYFEENSKRYHHIFDPKTGKPADSDLSSITITNPCSARTDAMTTAFFVMGKDKTIEFIKNNKYSDDQPYSIIMLSKDKKHVYVTEDLIDKGFEIEEEYKGKITVHVIKI